MPKRPNVILIVADDMGYGDFGVFNDGPAKTPHLDALVGEGVCLTQHYAGSPACLTAEIYKEKKGLYVSHCPQIGIASQGKEEEEAFNNLKEAVSLYLEEVTTATA